MKNISLEIDGKSIEVEEGTTILCAAGKLDIKIPTLCFHKALSPYGACRLCVVEISQEGREASIQTACTYPAVEGLVVKTDSPRALNTRKIMVELLLARCPDSKRIQSLAEELGVTKGRIEPKEKDCILCGLCARMCRERMGRAALGFVGRGLNREIQSPFGRPNEVCQACGACDFICPTERIILPDVSKNASIPISFEFNMGLDSRPAINIPFPQAVPNIASIDKKYCVHLQSGQCAICKEFCEAQAIDFEQEDETINIEAGAVILTGGVGLFDANSKKEYGYDRYENVITSIQFERILSASGPTKGEVIRPSDGQVPKKIAFIQCVGSRDRSCGNEFCSSVCCMYSIKEAIIAREHDSEIKPTIFYIDIRSFGKDFDRYFENAKDNHGIDFVRCMISKVYQRPKSKNLVVKFSDETGKICESEFDLVVLAVGMTDASKIAPLAKTLGIETNEYGFVRTSKNNPGETSRPGIFVAGTFCEPKDIPETVSEGSSAAALVSALLKNARGTLTKKKEYPLQRNVADEDVRIGVFVCRCGRNIGSVVNVPEVVEYASNLDGVVYSGEFLYSCSKDALDEIKIKIIENDLNRVVVASCTPRTHEDLFRNTIREAGLNKYLFEMTSLREHVAWVHRDSPEKATEKSKSLIDMMVAKTRLLKPLETQLSEVTPVALIIGGGAAGMQAALSVAHQGFETYLIEREDALGGNLRHLFYTLDQSDPQQFLHNLTEKVYAHDKIHPMTKSKVKELSGFVGNYKSVIQCGDEEKEIEHGVVIIATGAEPYQPQNNEYGFGLSPNIVTQVALEQRLAEQPENFSEPKTFVMIQCVGSRNEEHPYCSRVCCSQAIKNALKLKSINPGHRIIVLYRDIRTYGFLEKYYLKAREEGVVFSGFDVGCEPVVMVENGRINVKHRDRMLQKEVEFQPDWLILSGGISPGENDELAKVLKVPLTSDSFFLEAHAKIRPLDFTTEGMYLCGLAHSPRLLTEALYQAQGASVRACTVLSKDALESKAITASVNRRICKGCGLCVSTCPYGAREINEDNIACVIDALCQGCGACAVVCPSGATEHKGFNKSQILTMIEKTST